MPEIVFSVYFCHLPNERRWYSHEMPPSDYDKLCHTVEDMAQFMAQFPINSVFEVVTKRNA